MSTLSVELPTSKRSYISTTAFNGLIYSYTAQLNSSTFKNEGKLAPLTVLPSGGAVTSTNCPAGRILREVGRKLFPGVNPGLATGDKYNGVVVGNSSTDHLWVMVFDQISGLRGFIDPNAPTFAVYSTDRTADFVDNAENAAGLPTRLGQPVFTSGVVRANQMISSGGTVVIPLAGASTTYNFLANPSNFYQVNNTNAVNNGQLIVGSILPSGTIIYIFFTGFQTVLGTGFTYATSGANVNVSGGNDIVITFVSNGTIFLELSRTTLNGRVTVPVA